MDEARVLLEYWLEAKRDYDRIPGLSAAVVVDQEVVWIGGFGFADPPRGVPATGDSIYGICSVTKLFTSMAILQLRDQGKLRLEDPVSEILADCDCDKALGDSPPVTVRDLLTHTSGLPSDVDGRFSHGPEFEYPTRQELLSQLADIEALFPPSETFEYSNLGMALAGEVVSHVTERDFADYVDLRLLKPIGLQATTTRLPLELLGSDMAVGYSAMDRNGERSKVRPYGARAYSPALGFASTVRDLAAFAAWQFALLDGEDSDVFSGDSLREMYRPHFLISNSDAAQGLGFEVDLANGKQFVGHSGTCPGYVSRLSLKPDGRIAAIVMANSNNVDVWTLTAKMHEVVGSAVVAPVDGADVNLSGAGSVETALSDFTGLYSTWPWNADTAFISWKGGLAALRLSSNDPLADLRFWKHVEGDVFRRIRRDGRLAEKWTFLRDSGGRVDRVEVLGDYMKRIR